VRESSLIVLNPCAPKEKCLTTADEQEWRRFLPASRSVFGSVEYARICETFRGCDSRLFVVESEKATICHPIQLRPVGDLPFAAGVGGQWDSTTPDFTGPVVQGADHDLMAGFRERHGAFMRDQGVIAEFAHLHPWEQGRDLLGADCAFNRDIVWIDVTQDPEVLFRDHVKASCRRNINKAQREGVKIVIGADDLRLDEFYRIYCGTMRRNQALDNYYFSLDFFRRIRDDLPDNARFVFAEHEGRVVAEFLYMHDDDNVFLFLGGADAEFGHLRPTNMVVWDTVLWAHQAGKKRLILGAGYRPDDGIYQFKSSFSPLRQAFYIYKRIHRGEDYAILDQRCRELNGMGDEKIEYFPSYRCVRSNTDES